MRHTVRLRPRSGAFTIIEFLVAIFLIVVLTSILIPYVLKVREDARRARCAENLHQIFDALRMYASANKFQYPCVVYDVARQPTSYTSFTGPDEANPFAADSKVKANDVTASLWLLIRQGLLRDVGVFVCPGSAGTRDPMTDSAGRFVKPIQRGNFRRAANLSYGYSSPFSNAPNYRMDDTRVGDFAILADKGPGFIGSGGHLDGPRWDAPPLELAKLNSRNHNRAGQNVLYADSSVRFQSTAYCGAGRSPAAGGDNIYTALNPIPLNGQTPTANGNGWWSNSTGPARESDSYLVPTEDEGPR